MTSENRIILTGNAKNCRGILTLEGNSKYNSSHSDLVLMRGDHVDGVPVMKSFLDQTWWEKNMLKKSSHSKSEALN